MTHASASAPVDRRGTALWRSATVFYTIGAADFLAAFVLVFVSYFLGADALAVTAIYMFMGAWPVLFVAAVLDVLRHR
ncbi:hypothetical protein ACFJGV_08410 [Cnuibacter sp. UC19_7]|uniref:hypothetical protein n=1 Tax=Cnuibacter sp. UC19_7 TaxID=3350166 RepID=UPI00366D5307